MPNNKTKPIQLVLEREKQIKGWLRTREIALINSKKNRMEKRFV
jgi:predicted GIY-YIG superfamily endonuclease